MDRDSASSVGPSSEGSVFTARGSRVASTDAEEAAWLQEQRQGRADVEDEEDSDLLGRTMSIPVDAATLGAKEQKVSNADFEILKVLGRGAFGKVLLVRKGTGEDAGQLYAMKVMNKASIVVEAKTAEHTRAERNILEAIRKVPFVVHLHYAYQDEFKLHLVLDFVRGGDLFSLLRRKGRLPESDARFYISEIHVAIAYLHNLGIIYRDLKLENILLDSDGHIVLTDFGLSKEFVQDEEDRTYSYVGTVEYMAPEVIEGRLHDGHSKAADWWSLGVLLFELVAGHTPFGGDGISSTQLREKILKASPLCPSFFSIELVRFIKKLLTRNARHRLGYGPEGEKAIKRDPFFSCIDWDKLIRKELAPPFKPSLLSDVDVGNFDEEFTMQAATMSPGVPLSASARQVFRNFSFVAPSVVVQEQAQLPFDAFDSADGDETRPFMAFMRKYHVLEELGVGSFSSVRRCQNRETGEVFAVKAVSNCKANPKSEVNILRALQGHPNIVRLVDVMEDEIHTYIVMECLTGGELLDRIKNQERFTETRAREIFHTIATVVNHLHSVNIVHRDLKPENLIYENDSEDAQLKLVDFGFAREIKRGVALKTPFFSQGYAAPEVLATAANGTLEGSGYDATCDVWSLGVILFTMLCGYPPFAYSRDTTPERMLKMVREGDLKFPDAEWAGISSTAKELVRSLLNTNYALRPTMLDVMQHPWLATPTRRALDAEPPLFSPSILQKDDQETYGKFQFVPSSLSASFSASAGATGGHLAAPLPLRAPPVRRKSRTELTMGILHNAARDGILLLGDVANAPLAKRRKDRNDSIHDKSLSSDSEA